MKLSLSHLPFSPSDPIVVAVSGGIDSVVLLHMLKQEGFEQCVVAHVDHQLRETSAKDAEFVAELADDYGYAFEQKTVNIAELAVGKNVEAVGREQRYGFFQEIAVNCRAEAIVTAHHADDQLETVLMNIVRGCGLDGLTGMSEWERGLWKPILSMSKKQICEYARNHALLWREDESNQDEQYRRNALRHQIIPALKEMNPNLLQTMKNNLSVWNQAADLLLSQATLFVQEHRNGLYQYQLAPFLAMDEALQGFVLREIYAEVHGHRKDLERSHLDQVLKVLRTNVSGKQKEFGPGKILKRHKNHFEIISSPLL